MAVYVKAFYDWVEQTAALSDAERGRLFVAMLEYARSGEVPVLEGNERILFPVFKAQIDREEAAASVKAQSGAKGGRGKQTEAKASKRKQTENLQANFPNKEEEKEEENEYEEEYENEKEKEGVKEKGADALTTLSSLFSPYSFSTALQQSLEDWVQYKSERQEGYTERGLKALLRQIDSNVSRYGETAVRELMELSMASGWKGIIFDRLKDSPPQKEPCNPDDYYKGPKFGWGFEDEEEREWNL